jgi:hypothetical protein
VLRRFRPTHRWRKKDSNPRSQGSEWTIEKRLQPSLTRVLARRKKSTKNRWRRCSNRDLAFHPAEGGNALGSDVVLVDGSDLAKRVAAETGNAPITLALDGVSDISPMNLMNCLSESGVLVSHGGTSRKPMVEQPGSLIFKKQMIRGFWLFTGISQPSRMRSRRCSIIWRR